MESTQTAPFTYDWLLKSMLGNAPGTGAMLRLVWQMAHDLIAVGASASLFTTRAIPEWEEQYERLASEDCVDPEVEVISFCGWAVCTGVQIGDLASLARQINELGVYFFSGGPLPEGCGDSLEKWVARSEVYAQARHHDLMSWYSSPQSEGTWSAFATSGNRDESLRILQKRMFEVRGKATQLRDLLTPKVVGACAGMAEESALALLSASSIVDRLAQMTTRKDREFLIQAAREMSETFETLCRQIARMRVESEKLMTALLGDPPKPSVN